MRENAEAKGRRYLAEGRLTVKRVDASGIEAECKGTGAVWSVGWRPGEWYCSCPAVGRCSHLHALMRVCVRPEEAVDSREYEVGEVGVA